MLLQEEQIFVLKRGCVQPGLIVEMMLNVHAAISVQSSLLERLSPYRVVKAWGLARVWARAWAKVWVRAWGSEPAAYSGA